MAVREPMSSVDCAWLRMDDPTNLMMITGVLTFAEPVDYERVRRTVDQRLLRYERFLQRTTDPEGLLDTPHWELDPSFELDYHVRRLSLPEPGTQQELQKLVSDLMSVPLNRGRPLWQFHVIENFESGSAVIARLHHCIADGIALMRVLLSLTDSTPEEKTGSVQDRQRRRSPRGPFARSLRTARQAVSLTESVLHEGMETLRRPSRAVDIARMSAGSIARLGQILMRWPDPKTVFKGPLGVPKRAAWTHPIALADVKAVGEVTGGTVNDVLLTAMAGALRRYLLHRGERVDGLNFHAVVPVNLRPLDGPIELGNKFGLVFLSLPIGIADQIERLRELKRRMDELKRSPEAMALFGLLNIVGMGPIEIENLLLEIFGTKATGVMTNVPGPREQLYLAGSPLQDIMFWVPQSGRLGLGVSIMSYNGSVLMGVATDAGLVPDPEVIISTFHEEFEEMMGLVQMVDAEGQTEAEDGTPSLQEAVAALARATAALDTPVPQVTRCQATTLAGNRCRNRARSGSRYCHVHQQNGD